jgi:hypothetical protein
MISDTTVARWVRLISVEVLRELQKGFEAIQSLTRKLRPLEEGVGK